MWRTTQVPTEHEIEDKETILVVLESVSKVDNEWMVNLRQRKSQQHEKKRWQRGHGPLPTACAPE
jgi:hypothetical protein